MPSIYEVKKEIITASPNQWEFFDGPRQVYTFKPDPNIRMEQEDEFEDGYLHNWTEIFPDPNHDSMTSFTVYYGSSPIDTFAVVSTDGGRIQLPTPRVQNSEADDLDEYNFGLSRYRANIGRVMSVEDFDRWFPTDRVEILQSDFH